MKRSALQRIVGLNLAILVTLAALLRLVNWGEEGISVYAQQMASLIILMMLTNMSRGIYDKDKEHRQAHWLSFFLVLLIGFGLCGAGAMVPL